MFGHLLGHKWHIWLAWAALTVTHLIGSILAEDCSNSQVNLNTSVINNKTSDELLDVPECFSRRCQYHRQCSSDCPHTFCSGGRCLCDSGFSVDLSAQKCTKEVPLLLGLTVMAAIFSVAYLITFCCLKHDLLPKMKQLRPELAVRFSAVSQQQQSTTPNGHRRQSLDGESISSSSSSSLNDTFHFAGSTYHHHSRPSLPLPKSAVPRTSLPSSQRSINVHVANPKGHNSAANYENIADNAISTTEI